MAYKPVGVNEDSLFPTRVMTALKNLFLQSTDAATTYSTKSHMPFISVEDFKQDGDVDDTASWQRAVTAAIAGGVRRVLGNRTAYLLSGRIDVTGANGLVIAGAGQDITKLTVNGGAGSAVQSLFYNTGAFSNLVIEDMTIGGTIVDDVTGPRRSRTNSGGSGLNSAAIFQGDLNPVATGRSIVRNVAMRRVRIEKTNSLPFIFDGIRGFTKTFDLETYLTMDAGWIFCEKVVFDNIRSYKSADNGFSISRGNKAVIGGRAYVEMCAYFGFWLSGFLVTNTVNDVGPSNFNVENISVINSGKSGLALMDGPTNGRVGSLFVNGVSRGPSDEPTDIFCAGIQVGSYPSNNLQAPQVFAQNIVVENALLMNCARGGAVVSGSIDVMFGRVTVINAGTPYLANGTTAIASNNIAQNFGIAAESGAETTVTRLSVRALRVVDNRGVPVTNYPIYTTATIAPDVSQVSYSNTRQLATNDNTSDSYGGTKVFSGNVKLTGGATAGSNSGTGTLAGIDFNGAATAVRMHKFQTAGSDRWWFGANGTAESGTNAGTDFELRSRSDAGAFLFTIFTAIRSLSVWQWGRAHAEAVVAQTLSTSGAVTIDAAAGNIQRITLGANATTSTITNSTTGQRLTIGWTQDATGGRTFVWPTNCKFAGGAAPTPSTTATYRDRVMFEYDGTNWIEISRAIAVH